MISRIGKLVCEAAGTESFEQAQALRARDVALVVADDTDVMLLRSAVALTLRCFAGKTTIRPMNGSLHPDLEAAARGEAALCGSIDRLSIGGAREQLELGVGCNSGGLFVDARGWSVGVNTMSAASASPSAPASAFAAAAGVAKLFGALIGKDDAIIREQWTHSLLDFEDDATNNIVNFGRIVLIGAGAVGSAFAHVLCGSGWQGSITVVDHQRYDEPNHETTLLISRAATLRQSPKAETLASAIRSPSIAANFSSMKVGSSDLLLRDSVDAIVCAVDNAELRRCLDVTSAGTVFNAGVGGAAEDAGHVLWTRHARHEPPLSLHYRQGSASFDAATRRVPSDISADECSRLAYRDVSLAAPFMALAAGALLAAGIAQQALKRPAPTNYMKFDLLGLQQWSVRRSLGLGEPGSPHLMRSSSRVRIDRA